MLRFALAVAVLLSPSFAQPADPSVRLHHLLVDWAGLTRYGSENAELRAPKPGETRVVFLGDRSPSSGSPANSSRASPI